MCFISRIPFSTLMNFTMKVNTTFEYRKRRLFRYFSNSICEKCRIYLYASPKIHSN